MQLEFVKNKKDLGKLYQPPMDLVLKKQQKKLDQYSLQFLSLSPFIILSTSNKNSNMDCSPRGDHAGFVQALDDYTIAIPDRPGNNRLDTLNNIIDNPNIGILVLVPGFNECLRINGSAKIAINSDLLARFEYQGKQPKSVIVVSINEIYFHCAKSITRAALWQESSNVDRCVMPSLGKILMAQIDPSKTAAEVKAVEVLINNRVKTTLY